MTSNSFVSSLSLEEIAEHESTRSVLELLHTGISIMDAKGYFLYSNKAFLEMFDLPNDVRGKHVCDFFLTGEQGVMAAIRTRKMNMHSSITTGNEQGVSFRYPVMDKEGKLLGIIIESVSTKIGKEKLLTLLDTIRNLENKVEYFDQRAHAKRGGLYTFDDLVGESEVMEAMKERGRRFARSNEPILLLGESGTGKELIAQALHCASPRAEKSFVAVNCAALPSDLMDAELFGYGKGAFTGAKSGGMQGKFELADKGTIFLDEIGDIPLLLQAKLLRVLESGEIQKIAYPKPLQSDFRLIAATNKNLAQLVNEGVFREDLYHRLNTLEFTIPPLRERISDVPLLTRHFVMNIVGYKRAREIHISNELYRVFGLHPWRGNVRELKNVLTFALLSLDSDDHVLQPRHLPQNFLRELHPDGHEVHNDSHEVDDGIVSEISDLTKAGASAERTTLMRVLASTQYNKTLAARILGNLS